MIGCDTQLYGKTHDKRRHRVFALAALALTMTSVAPAVFAQSQSGFTFNGIVYTSYQANEYAQTPTGPQGAAAIRATGANYTSVLATQYQQTYTSNVIAPETASTPGYLSSVDPLSPTDAAVSAAIQNLQAQGLTVFLKPQVDSLDGTFRALFAPTDVAAWFASYQVFILHYAQLAVQNNVGGLVIGTELKSLSGSAYRSYWVDLIAQMRSSYASLTLVYGANATGATDEFTTVSFWDKVDVIGVDGYFPLTDHADPTVAQLVAAWSGNLYGFNIVAALKQLQSQYNKPLIFTELGYVSATGTNEAPYSLAANGAAYDPLEQQNCYEAFFEVFSQQTSWMKGVFWWAWSVPAPAAGDTEYTPQNKPAGIATLPLWFGSTTPAFTLTPSNFTLAVGQGLNAADTIAVTNLGGFAGPVTLSASGLPPGVSVSFAPGTAPSTQVMTLAAGTGAAMGPATVTVTGTSGSAISSTSVALNIQGLAPQTITFNSPGGQTVGTPLTLMATASSGLAVSYSSLTTSVCTVSNATATFLSAGTCTILANQSGNASFAPAMQVRQSFTVSLSASFTLAPAAATLAIAQGSSASTTLTVSGANGFSGNVSFAASGLPAGVTASFAPNLTSNTSVLTLTASSTATLGVAAITLTGVSGSLSVSTMIALTVNLQPSFTLTSANPALSLIQGGSASDTIAVSGVNGFSGSVTLTASSLPSGVIASFGMNPSTGSSVLNFTATSTATIGSGPVLITGTSGTLSASTSITLTVAGPTSFNLMPAAAMVSAAQGGIATDAVTIAGAGGFSGNVTLTASGLPSGVSASFAPNSATSFSVITFTANSTATVGASTVTLTGTSGSLTASATVLLIVSAAAGLTLAPSSAAVSVTQGSSATDSITIASTGGFSGSVLLTASVFTGSAGAAYPPTVSFGATNPVSLSSAGLATSILTINTTAATTGALTLPSDGRSTWGLTVGTLAGVLLLSFPAKRLKRFARWSILAFTIGLAGGLIGCGGGAQGGSTFTGVPGTTRGIYTVTVTATSGFTAATETIRLTVQ